MAVQSHHDVVNQSRSADALSSVDVSAFNATNFAARAADEASSTAFASHNGRRSSSIDDVPRATSVTLGNISPGGAVDRQSALNDGTNLEDEAKGSTAGDGSIGSDVETSKADSQALGVKDGEGRETALRTTVKKSASFKPVSVTKNFLAKAGSTVVPSKSTLGGDKLSGVAGGSTAPGSQSTPRPRLVAKSISGQKGILARSSSISGPSGPNGGPDPSHVWNKNRVQVTTATPKHLTDEELRLQYGIQLASRPVEGEDSNQAKWADIDDEDDWAPETIEWNDGTKINLAETSTNISTEQADTNAEKFSSDPGPKETEQETSTPRAKISSIGPNPTVLKLGSASQPKPAGAAAKSVSDKPTLVTKAGNSTPVRSPWATLPPVDKVPPVPINPPAPNLPSRFGQRDSHGIDSIQPPAKEIDADDFSRFRDHPNGNPRELYVPHSGRYEAANDARRGSFRKDGAYRQPSLLQRPTAADREQSGPAEPSSAFQTSRSQQDGLSWIHRRGSSGASMDGARLERRMSSGRHPEARAAIDPQGSRASQLDHRDASPSNSHGPSATSQSPTVSTAPDASTIAVSTQQVELQNPTVPQTQSMEDAVVMQKRLMREKREAAIKRRQEEEARHEAERRERIRQKLEKLGMPTDNKPVEKKSAETERQEREAEDIASPTVVPIASSSLKEQKDRRPVLASTPPKPPIPSPSGEPQQYGLMKVHAPQPGPLTSPRSSQVAVRATHSTASTAEPKNLVRTDTVGQVSNGDVATRAADLHSSRHDAAARDADGDVDADGRPWSNIPAQSPSQFPNWKSSVVPGHSSQGANLWGPPTNHRALGNGGFQSNIQRSSLNSSQAPYNGQNVANPQPIGTPRHPSQQSSNQPSATTNISDLLAGTIAETPQIAPNLSTETDSLTHGLSSRADDGGSSAKESKVHQLHASPGTTAPIHRTQTLEASSSGVAAWSHFSQNSTRLEAEQVAQENAAQENAARLNDSQIGVSRPNILPMLNETWKQVKRGDEHGTRQIVGKTQLTNNYAPSSQNPNAEFNRAVAPPSGASYTRSRYQDIFDHQHRSATSTPPGPRAISPTSVPPPETAEHPAYGVGARPMVKLPGHFKTPQEMNENIGGPRGEPFIGLDASPTVKLPPPTSSRPLPPRSSTRQLSYSNIVKISSASTKWQNRFDSLFDRESKIPSPPVLSATKPHFDLMPIGSLTPVSLPTPSKERVAAPTSSAEEEEALFEEERAFGSTPTICVPQNTSMEIWTIAPVPDYKKFPPRSLRDEQVFTVRHDLAMLGDESRNLNTSIAIFLPGMSRHLSKSYSRRSHGPHRIAKTNNRPKPRSAPKSREVSHGQTRANWTEASAGTSSNAVPTRGGNRVMGRQAGLTRKASGVV